MTTPRSRPALFDLQVNGFAGVDYQQPTLSGVALRESVDALRRHSIHRILLTLITDEIDAMCRQLERIETLRQADAAVGETVCGYHLEGPYLSAAAGYCGAHPPAKMRVPSIAELRRLNDAAGGSVRLVTLAPELPGSAEFIRAARQAGIVISLGHTQAGDADIDAAIAAGASLCTHLGNAVPATLPRHDNVVQRLLARDELTACFIPDGFHLPPNVLKNFVRAKPPGKTILTSDAVAAAGAPPGNYTVGPLQITSDRDGVVREPGRPNFAGSSLLLDRGVDHAASWIGIPHADAWAMASVAVAKIFNIALPVLDPSPS
ncbi:MAG: N-acetylglucosamine-6-phosphate deacetylase [Verrucomicrobia bacterium]|nr:N-acetylglucosamine-6-phosphate deacetylase [Verrucomicrobiota bacterium]